jgi:hypothetical protein
MTKTKPLRDIFKAIDCLLLALKGIVLNFEHLNFRFVWNHAISIFGFKLFGSGLSGLSGLDDSQEVKKNGRSSNVEPLPFGVISQLDEWEDCFFY